jgi:bile acid:Na+ symporter, BASS family
MHAQQWILSLLLALMVFSVALDVTPNDFARVLKMPRSVIGGLIPQFILLPAATWGATLLLDLPANIEVAMILVASCPGGSLSNVVTHFGRGNTALSVSISAAASLIALFATPFNFAWMVAHNPNTASWLKVLAIDPNDIWFSLVLLLALPMSLGLAVATRLPAVAAKVRKPLARVALLLLGLFIVGGLVKERQQLNLNILPLVGLVMAHNALGLSLGWLAATAMRLAERDRRAVVIEGGMQNAGLALGIIAVQFNNDLGMVTLASLWGIWHIVSGMGLALHWRRYSTLPSNTTDP